MNPNFQKPERDSVKMRPYLLHSPIEITGVLRQLATKHVTCTLFYSDDLKHLPVRIIAVQADSGTLLLALGGDSVQTRALKEASDLTAVAFTGAVKLQFRLDRAALTRHEGEEVLRAALPAELMRLQRRSDFRVPTPVGDPVTCSIGVPGETRPRVQMTVLEMSCGGLGMMVDAGRLEANEGQVFSDVELDLNEDGVVNPRIELRHIAPMLRDGRYHDRFGFAFVRLPGSTSKLIQQYVMALDRRRNKR